ncbi:hypothetical protein [Paenibacillus taichungensis]|jgi:hypothetical protein
MSTIENILGTYPIDFERAALVFDEEKEIWANCKYIHKTGEIYEIELNETNYNLPFESAFLWRTNGERMQVMITSTGRPFTSGLAQSA